MFRKPVHKITLEELRNLVKAIIDSFPAAVTGDAHDDEVVLHCPELKGKGVGSSMSREQADLLYRCAQNAEHSIRKINKELGVLRAAFEEAARLPETTEGRRRAFTDVSDEMLAPLALTSEGMPLLVAAEIFKDRASRPVGEKDGFLCSWPELLELCDRAIPTLRGVVGAAAERQMTLREALLPRLDHLFRPPAGMGMLQVDVLHHREFEQLVADLLDRDGYHIVRSGGGAGDQGADVLAMDDLGRYLMVQCKHRRDGQGSVGQDVAQHLWGGAMALHSTTLPIIVTNSRFTGSAKVWAAEGNRVRLIGREELTQWAQEGKTLGEVLKKP
nr:restriction endonuclease [Streptomyces alkaliphilus]